MSTLHAYASDRDPEVASARMVHVVQGEYAIVAEPDVVLTTILGSCVAACITDPMARVGGMNHFLLPGSKEAGSDSLKYGVHSMELLINGLLQRGAMRSRLQAKLFGGAHVVVGLSDVGQQNCEFAERFLTAENIACMGKSLGGDRARRIRYWPMTGRASMQLLAPTERQVFEAERRRGAPTPPPAAGDVELF